MKKKGTNITLIGLIVIEGIILSFLGWYAFNTDQKYQDAITGLTIAEREKDNCQSQLTQCQTELTNTKRQRDSYGPQLSSCQQNLNELQREQETAQQQSNLGNLLQLFTLI